TPTAAVLTPRGRGAVASILVRAPASLCDRARSDDDPLFRAANGRPFADQPVRRIVFGRWGDPGEDVVLCRRSGKEFEIHCHGGESAVGRIVDALREAGCTIVSWRDALQFERDLLDSELIDALSRAPTQRSAAVLLDQSQGTLRAEIDAVSRCAQADDFEGAAERLATLLRWKRFALHLTCPWSVVLAGRPNVGKSSLINALVGYARSIVYDQPGTTRDVVTADTALDGWPVQLADTAGMRDQAGNLEAAGIERARAHFAEADCRVLVLDASCPPTSSDPELLAQWPDALRVAHKADLPDHWGDAMPAEAIRVSSLTSTGLDALVARIVEHLVPECPAAGMAVPINARQFECLERAANAVRARKSQEAVRSLVEFVQGDVTST
ncbi:MAG TPA: GTPase, partial [Planctomycetaceae bacterium]|nr:GTPase [Planctomycetaceae bacterium]